MGDTFQALGVDCGASSGRVLLGSLSADNRLEVRDIRRFPNQMVHMEGGLHWEFDRLIGEVRAGIDDAFREGCTAQSLAVDTWGVDYVLYGADGRPLKQPFAYRNARTEGMMEKVFAEVISAEEIYAITGIQFLPFNTVYQLAAEVAAGGENLRKAQNLILMPDAFTYELCGQVIAEATMASTTQLIDARTRKWSDEIIDRIGVPRRLFPDITEPGTIVGKYRPQAADADLDVVACGGHDTASAVAAVPATGDVPWAYVSSGTWALVGVETREPLLTDEACQIGVTNEGGVDATYRLLKNVTGLWILQECMRLWEERGQGLTIQQVCAAAAEAPEDGPLVDPDDPAFTAPEDMTAEIVRFCKRTGQTPPDSAATFARCVFESLALKTAYTLDRVSGLAGVRPEVIHMVGGGSRNEMLCRMTAEAAGMPVVAGPSEATAIGNLLVQAMAGGRIGSLDELRSVVRNSVDLVRYEPCGDAYWGRRMERLRNMLR